MLRKHTFSIEEYYHLYNRGTDKREIFLDVHDYHRFIILLYLCNSDQPVSLEKLFRQGRSFTELFTINRGNPIVSIGAWILMPNHFHILIKEITENGIATFMRKVMTGYSMYFNKKYNRNGNLFQGRFKSEHANNDEYLKYLFSYIHLNPVKLISGESNWKENGIKDIKKAKEFLSQYEYSSLQDYLDQNKRYKNIISKKEFPEYFSKTKDIWNELLEWLNFVKDGPLQEKNNHGKE
ncbi:MAG: transposase [Candidatus Paceibacterota bacterium]|jgi:putative transposase